MHWTRTCFVAAYNRVFKNQVSRLKFKLNQAKLAVIVKLEKLLFEMKLKL